LHRILILRLPLYFTAISRWQCGVINSTFFSVLDVLRETLSLGFALLLPIGLRLLHVLQVQVLGKNPWPGLSIASAPRRLV